MSLQLVIVPTPGTAQRIFTTLLISCGEDWLSGHAREGSGPAEREGERRGRRQDEGDDVVTLQSCTLSRTDTKYIHLKEYTQTHPGEFIYNVYMHIHIVLYTTHTHTLSDMHLKILYCKVVVFAYCAFLMHEYTLYLHFICIFVLHMHAWLLIQQAWTSPYICTVTIWFMSPCTSSICIKA